MAGLCWIDPSGLKGRSPRGAEPFLSGAVAVGTASPTPARQEAKKIKNATNKAVMLLKTNKSDFARRGESRYVFENTQLNHVKAVRSLKHSSLALMKGHKF
jgi:hypothetical protein